MKYPSRTPPGSFDDLQFDDTVCWISTNLKVYRSGDGVVFSTGDWHQAFTPARPSWVDLNTALMATMRSAFDAHGAVNKSVQSLERQAEQLRLSMSLSRSSGPTQAPQQNRSERTIGLTWPKAMRDEIDAHARAERGSAAAVARRFFRNGLNELDEAIEAEKKTSVLERFRSFVGSFESETTDRWMLRVNRNDYADATVIAKELDLPLSEVALMCIASSLRILRGVLAATPLDVHGPIDATSLADRITDLLRSMRQVTVTNTLWPASLPKERSEFDFEARFSVLGKDVRALIQCRSKNSHVDCADVRSMQEQIRRRGADLAILFSVSAYDQEALRLAEKYGIATVQVDPGDAAVKGWLLRSRCKAEISSEDPVHLEAQLHMACASRAVLGPDWS